MNNEEKSSWKITLLGVGAALLRSGVAAGIVAALISIGSIWRDVSLQREQLSAHEESQTADVERMDEKNDAQDEKIADHGETLAKVLVILEQNEKTLTRLETKVDRMDTFLRDFLREGKGSVRLDEEGSEKNVPTSLSI